ncbi:hypothetical protein [Streptomyces sp. NPDC002962]|uniref:hypothetical protein n=1 Tax=Streptomyces sp. NPDC002962 TaxID=3364674 RepID=UPI00369B536F
MVLAAAARAAATPLRRTGRTTEALYLLNEARLHLTAGSRPTAAGLDAAGMVASPPPTPPPKPTRLPPPTTSRPRPNIAPPASPATCTPQPAAPRS